MGDNKGSPPTGDCQHGPADPLLRHRIHGAGGLIQNQNRGLLKYGAGNGEKLAFPLAQGGAALGEYCIVALGQAADEGISAGGFRCGPDAFRQNVLITVADIVPDTHAKERRILKHHAEGAAQILQPVLPEIAAV